MIRNPTNIFPKAPLLLRNVSGLKFDKESMPGLQGDRRYWKLDSSTGRDGLLWYSHNPWFAQSKPTGDDAFRLSHLQNHPLRSVDALDYSATVGHPTVGSISSEANAFGNCPVFNHGTSTSNQGHSVVWQMTTSGGYVGGTSGALAPTQGGWTLLAMFKPGGVDSDHRCFFSGRPPIGGNAKGMDIGYRNQSGHYTIEVRIHDGASLVSYVSPNISSYQDADGYFRLAFNFNSTGPFYSAPFVAMYDRDGVQRWWQSTSIAAGLPSPSSWDRVILGANYTAKESQSWRGPIGHMSMWSGSHITERELQNWWRAPWWFLREEPVPVVPAIISINGSASIVFSASGDGGLEIFATGDTANIVFSAAADVSIEKFITGSSSIVFTANGDLQEFMALLKGALSLMPRFSAELSAYERRRGKIKIDEAAKGDVKVRPKC